MTSVDVGGQNQHCVRYTVAGAACSEGSAAVMA